MRFKVESREEAFEFLKLFAKKMMVHFHIPDDVTEVTTSMTGYMYNSPGGFRKPVYKWTLWVEEKEDEDVKMVLEIEPVD